MSVLEPARCAQSTYFRLLRPCPFFITFPLHSLTGNANINANTAKAMNACLKAPLQNKAMVPIRDVSKPQHLIISQE